MAHEREPRQHDEGREAERRRRSRNVALAVLLFVLVVLFYLITILRMGARGS